MNEEQRIQDTPGSPEDTENDGWIDIARMGVFTDSNGRTHNITEDDIERLIAEFDETDRRIPLVFGHPKVNAPAFGWVETMRRTGDVLQARFRQVHDDVKTLVRNGNYKNVSVALSPDKARIAHVGLLGAVQPAISGLREVAFSSQDAAIVIEFSRNPAEDVSRMRHNLNAEWAELRKYQETMNAQKRAERMNRLKETVNQGRIEPAVIGAYLEFAEALDNADTMIQFSSGSTPVHPVDALADILERYPVSPLNIDFSQFAPKPRHAQELWEQGKQGKQGKHGETATDNNPAYLI